jgi:hypothetical protein
MVAEQKPQIEPDRSFEEWLRKTVELLCAKRDPLFPYETELRLCQLKAWLLGVGDDLSAVRRTAMTFTAAIIGRMMARIRQKRPHHSPGVCLMTALMDQMMLFNFASPPPLNLYDLLLKSLSFKDVCHWAAKDADEIRCLNELTRWRLRLARTEGFRPTLNAGLDAYEAARDPAKDYGKNKLKRFHKARARREAFLFVATTACPNIIEITPNPAKMLRLLDDQAKQTELFKGYFARCQTALELLQEKNPAAATLCAWSGVDAIPLDDVEPITEHERETLGLYPEGRRSAETTTRAKRQKPT